MQHAAVTHGGTEHLVGRFGVYAVLGPQHHRFHDTGQNDADEELVLEFYYGACTERTDVEDVLAHGLEERLGFGERVRLAARHDGERAGLGSHGSAADGRVDELDLLLGECRADTLGRRRVDSAMVYKHLTRARAVNSARVSQEDFLYVFGHRNAGEHEVGTLRRFPWTFHQRTAGTRRTLPPCCACGCRHRHRDPPCAD